MKMGQNLWNCQRLWSLAIFTLFFLILSSTHFRFQAQAGRPSPKSGELSQTSMMMTTRSQIGSRPPRCERRCSTCEHCEAIQVPTNPQMNSSNNNGGGGGRGRIRNNDIAYARGGNDDSNYKPMSWKCKCGNLIFNP